MDYSITVWGIVIGVVGFIVSKAVQGIRAKAREDRIREKKEAKMKAGSEPLP